MTIIFYYFFEILSALAGHATDSIPPHALCRWRLRGACVDRDGLPASPSMRLRVVFLPVRRVLSYGGCGRDGGQLKLLAPFSLSLARKSTGEAPDFVTFAL